MREQKTKAYVKKEKHEIIPTPCPSTYTLIWINPLHLPYPLIIYNNNKMDTELLVQMTQSDKSESVGNHEIINLHLRSGVGP